jgi:hypothetical protein
LRTPNNCLSGLRLILSQDPERAIYHNFIISVHIQKRGDPAFKLILLYHLFMSNETERLLEVERSIGSDPGPALA